jgi:hypothetical protein
MAEHIVMSLASTCTVPLSLYLSKKEGSVRQWYIAAIVALDKGLIDSNVDLLGDELLPLVCGRRQAQALHGYGIAHCTLCGCSHGKCDELQD